MHNIRHFRRAAKSEPTEWKNLNLLAKPLPDITEAKKQVEILASEETIFGVKTFVQVKLAVFCHDVASFTKNFISKQNLPVLLSLRGR